MAEGYRKSILPIAKEESLKWLNSTIQKLWPNINAAAIKIVNDTVVPKLQESVPGPLKGIHFKEFTLGTQPLTLGPVKMYDLGDRGLMMRVGVDYKSDTDIEIEVMHATVGVKNLALTGELTVRFSQLLPDQLPIVGSIEAYFLDCPKISFELVGVVNFPGFYGILKKFVKEGVSGALVFPNQIAKCLGTEEQGVDMAACKCPTPIGMLKVRPIGGIVRGSDWHMFKKSTSDPYCIVQLCNECYKTSTVKKIPDKEPFEWPDTDYHCFLVYDRAQKISCEVWDDDIARPDDLLGHTEPRRISDMLDDAQIKDSGLSLYDSNPAKHDSGELEPNGGCLKLDVEFFKILHGERNDSEMCVMRIKIDEAYLPAGSKEKAVKVMAKLKQGDTKVSLSTPVGTAAAEKAVNDGVNAALVGIVDRAAKMEISTKDIAEIVNIEEEQVEAIVKGGPYKMMESPVVVEIEASLFLTVRRDKLDEATVELVIATSKDKYIASKEINVSDVLSSETMQWPKSGRVECTGVSGHSDVPLDVQISIHSTQKMSADEGKLEFEKFPDIS